MSAGMQPSAAEPRPSKDLSLLAPKFAAAVRAALTECHALGLDATVFEAYRSLELQQLYYARGRTVRPPYHTVTNAKSNLYSWHGYGLAVDVISERDGWFNPDGKPELRLPAKDDPGYAGVVQARRAYMHAGQRWFKAVAEVFKRHGCDWGGDWKQADTPHFQWGRLRASPSDRARELLREGGMVAVWLEVGAADAGATAPKLPGRPELRRGAAGADVRTLQLALTRLGFALAADGDFGPRTEGAVRAFQASRGMRVTGVVDEATWARIT